MAPDDRIVVLNGYPLEERHRQALAAVSDRLQFIHTSIETQEDLDVIEDPDVEAILGDFVPTERSRLPRLRWLQYSGAGVDPLTDRAPWRRGITVTSASGNNSIPIAEYVLTWLLHVASRTEERIENQRRRQWTETRIGLTGRGLRGRTLAIVGYGSVGREVARLAHAFGMGVLAAKARPDVLVDDGFRLAGTGDPDGSIPQRVVGFDRLGEIIAEAEFVLVSAPLTAATRGALGAAVLAALRRDAWLINIGRGGLFDEAALTEALRERRFGGAVLDVTVTEPLDPSSELWRLPNVIVTPHVAGLSETTWDTMTQLFAENLRRYVAGERLLNLVDPEAGY
ncbi:MAG TPA: D-2-hydroxyacid dehydrogenase [Candidatus Limnocylindrales bacterium]|jgi:phosphoglycerate dehydrogenase-like enzyme|nr:D-2-hydroxyacid dehydrogenase [Candidatus Limnocylindrales bacterium]